MSRDQMVPIFRLPAGEQSAHDALRARVLAVIQDHRRVRNVRSCSAKGCDWHPVRPGNTSDPDDTRRRHEQFNEHVTDLIMGLL